MDGRQNHEKLCKYLSYVHRTCPWQYRTQNGDDQLGKQVLTSQYPAILLIHITLIKH